MNRIPLFSLSPQQDERRRTWIKQHAEQFHPNGVRDMSGAAFEYTILPTGCGDNITIRCIWCPCDKVVLTEDDDGEFLYNLDGTKSWCAKASFGQSKCTDTVVHIQECQAKGVHMSQVDHDGDCKFCCHH